MADLAELADEIEEALRETRDGVRGFKLAQVLANHGPTIAAALREYTRIQSMTRVPRVDSNALLADVAHLNMQRADEHLIWGRVPAVQFDGKRSGCPPTAALQLNINPGHPGEIEIAMHGPGGLIDQMCVDIVRLREAIEDVEQRSTTKEE